MRHASDKYNNLNAGEFEEKYEKDEPVFFLRAKDSFMTSILETYIDYYEDYCFDDSGFVEERIKNPSEVKANRFELHKHLMAVREWQSRNKKKVSVPAVKE